MNDLVNELTERELQRICDDAEALMSIIQDRDRSLISRLNQVQMLLQSLQNRNITISELKGQITLLNKQY